MLLLWVSAETKPVWILEWFYSVSRARLSHDNPSSLQQLLVCMPSNPAMDKPSRALLSHSIFYKTTHFHLCSTLPAPRPMSLFQYCFCQSPWLFLPARHFGTDQLCFGYIQNKADPFYSISKTNSMFQFRGNLSKGVFVHIMFCTLTILHILVSYIDAIIS